MAEARINTAVDNFDDDVDAVDVDVDAGDVDDDDIDDNVDNDHLKNCESFAIECRFMILNSL